MKKIKIFILIIVAFLLCGCSGKYTLKINSDSTLEEIVDLKIIDDGNTYSKTMNLFEKYDVDNDNYTIIRNDDGIRIKYNEKYKSLEDYILNSKLYSQFFDNINFTRNDNVVDIRTSSKLKLDSNDSENIVNDYNVSSLKINIETPLQVIDNNADKVSNNKYTWNLSSKDTEKSIMISFNPINKSDNYIYIIVISLIGFIIFIFIMIFLRRIKKENKL